VLLVFGIIAFLLLQKYETTNSQNTFGYAMSENFARERESEAVVENAKLKAQLAEKCKLVDAMATQVDELKREMLTLNKVLLGFTSTSRLHIDEIGGGGNEESILNYDADEEEEDGEIDEHPNTEPFLCKRRSN